MFVRLLEEFFIYYLDKYSGYETAICLTRVAKCHFRMSKVTMTLWTRVTYNSFPTTAMQNTLNLKDRSI